MISGSLVSRLVAVFVWFVVFVAAWTLFRKFAVERILPTPPPPQRIDPVAESLKNRVLMYSNHAIERMLERGVWFSEVEYVKKNGAVNWAKSQPTASYSLEATMPGSGPVRVVLSPSFGWFATVVTVIRL